MDRIIGHPFKNSLGHSCGAILQGNLLGHHRSSRSLATCRTATCATVYIDQSLLRQISPLTSDTLHSRTRASLTVVTHFRDFNLDYRRLHTLATSILIFNDSCTLLIFHFRHVISAKGSPRTTQIRMSPHV